MKQYERKKYRAIYVRVSDGFHERIRRAAGSNRGDLSKFLRKAIHAELSKIE